MKTALKILLWMALGIPGMGWESADFSYQYPRQSIRGFIGQSVAPNAIGGPVSSFILFSYTGFAEHGWCLTVASCQKIAASNKE